MPYIKQSGRSNYYRSLIDLLEKLKDNSIETGDLRNLDGDLNYIISQLLLISLNLTDDPKYTRFNTAIGVLESCKLELYRRFVAPYEDIKIKENGDIR
jgi:hypothetical protein